MGKVFIKETDEPENSDSIKIEKVTSEELLLSVKANKKAMEDAKDTGDSRVKRIDH